MIDSTTLCLRIPVLGKYVSDGEGRGVAGTNFVDFRSGEGGDLKGGILLSFRVCSLRELRCKMVLFPIVKEFKLHSRMY